MPFGGVLGAVFGPFFLNSIQLVELALYLMSFTTHFMKFSLMQFWALCDFFRILWAYFSALFCDLVDDIGKLPCLETILAHFIIFLSFVGLC
jgi:hypothetical protein